MKKRKVVKQKDPKKVAAGKARAAKSLRINGRFTSNDFFKDVDNMAKEAGVKDTFKFFQQNETEFIQLYTSWMESAQIFDYAFMNTVKDYHGHIIVNENENSKGTALQKVLKFNQFLRNELNVAAWKIKPMIKLSGYMKITLPNAEDMEQMEGMDTADIIEMLEGMGVEIIISEKKGKKKNKIASRKGKYKRIEYEPKTKKGN